MAKKINDDQSSGFGPAFSSSLATGLGSAASGVATSIIGGLFDMAAAKKAHERDIEKMRLQSSLNREQYDYERAMESPAMIAQQYRNAGLNPALAMTGGATSPGLSSSIGSTDVAAGSARSRLPLPMPSSSGTAISQNELMREEAELNRAMAKDKWLDVKRKNSVYTDDYFAAERLSAMSDAHRKQAESALAKLKEIEETKLSSLYDLKVSTNARQLVASAELAEKRVTEQIAIIDNLQKEGVIKDEEANKMRAETRTELQRYNVELARASQLRALATVAEKDAELKSEQARKITHDIIAGYINAGANAVGAITDIVSMLTPILGLGKATRTATRVVKEMTDKDGNLVGKSITTTDTQNGYTNVPH